MDFETTYQVQLTTTDGSVFSVNDVEDLTEGIKEVLHFATRERKLPKTYRMFRITTRKTAGRAATFVEEL